MSVQIHDLIGMGVINITPNSFSDGGKNLISENLQNSIKLFSKSKNIIIDFGFESTAPMNDSISLTEESERFKFLLNELRNTNLDKSWISFDTYKIENFKFFYFEFLKKFPNSKIILNDVSGVLDKELSILLDEFQHFSNFYYVFSVTNTPTRDLTVKHMDYTSENEILDQMLKKLNQFVHFSNYFPKLKGRLFLDPAFGFSKTYSQNWELLDKLPHLIKAIESQFGAFPWIIGLSKKSFLKKKLEDSNRPISDLEIIHRDLINDLRSNIKAQLIFRVHDLDILK